MRIWARLTVGHPILFIGIMVAITAFCCVGLRRLRFDTSPNAVFSSNDDSNNQLHRLHAVFGPDDNDLLLMIQGDDLLAPVSIDRLRRLRDHLQSLDGVAAVASVFDLRGGRAMLPLLPEPIPASWDAAKIRNDLTRNPAAAGQLISRSGELLVFWVLLKGTDLSHSQISAAIGPIDAAIDRFESDTRLKVWKSGHPAIRDGVLSSIQGSLYYGSAIAALAGMIASLLLFRGLAPVAVCMFGPVLGLIWTFGLMGWCRVSIGGLTSSLPSLIVVIGLTDAVHLLLAANRSLAAGHNRRRAIYETLFRVGPACLLTSLTTMIGFGSLLLSRLDAVAEFGLWAGLGSVAALVADLCVLPLAIRFLPEAYLQSRRGSSVPWMERILNPVANLPLRMPIRISLIGIVGFLALLPFAMDQRVDIRWTEAIPENTDTNAAMRIADAQLDGALPVLIVVDWPAALTFPSSEINIVAGQVSKAVKETPGFAGPASIYNTLAGLPGRSWPQKYRWIEDRHGAVDRILNVSQDQLLVSTRVPNDGALALQERLQRLQAKLQPIRDAHPEFQIDVTGTVVAAAQNMRAVIGDLARSLSAASLMIFAAMTIQFRSLKIGLISLIPNMLPLLITAAGLSLLGYPLQITSALTFSLCLGLAVDDTIHVLTHFQHDRRANRSVDHSLRITMLRVGPALLLTTGILLAGFGAMLLNPMPAIQMFAALCCITMISALLGDLIVLPALLLVAYRGRQ